MAAALRCSVACLPAWPHPAKLPRTCSCVPGLPACSSASPRAAMRLLLVPCLAGLPKQVRCAEAAMDLLPAPPMAKGASGEQSWQPVRTIGSCLPGLCLLSWCHVAAVGFHAWPALQNRCCTRWTCCLPSLPLLCGPVARCSPIISSAPCHTTPGQPGSSRQPIQARTQPHTVFPCSRGGVE